MFEHTYLAAKKPGYFWCFDAVAVYGLSSSALPAIELRIKLQK